MKRKLNDDNENVTKRSLSSSSTALRSEILVRLMNYTPLPIEINKVIDSYLSLYYLFSNANKNKKWYKMNVEDKKWLPIPSELPVTDFAVATSQDLCMFTQINNDSCLVIEDVHSYYIPAKYNFRIYRLSSDHTWIFLGRWALNDDCNGITVHNHVYLIGGSMVMHEPLSVSYLACVRKIDLSNQQGKFVSFMNQSRSRMSSVAYHNSIYVFGGYSTYGELHTCERYDMDEDKWIAIANMPSSHCGGQAVVWNEVTGEIVVMGGYDTFQYHVPSNTWKTLKNWELPHFLINPNNGFIAYMICHYTQVVIISQREPSGCWYRSVHDNDWISLPFPK